MNFNVNYRDLFVGLDTPVILNRGLFSIPINFDNGATTPPLKCALNSIMSNSCTYGPISRGSGQKGDMCTKKYDESRKVILNFFNLKDVDTHTVIYTKTATESLNLLANLLIKNKSDKVLTTRMEHHANDLPWRDKATVNYINVDSLGRIHVDDIEEHLIRNNGSIKFVAVTGASNVTGYINPINEIAKICHKYNAKLIVDAAQLVAHKKIDMKGNNPSESIDFLVFSAHKAYAPFGSGAIVGIKEAFVDSAPLLKGGGSVMGVFDNSLLWDTPPDLHEAGSPNFLGTLAMVKSLEELSKIGFDNIFNHEIEIKDFLIGEMKKIKGIKLYGDITDTSDRLGIIPFNIENKYFESAASILADEYGIALRAGKFCAHPYVTRLLGVSDSDAFTHVVDTSKKDYGMLRLSLGLYNTLDEAEIFVNALKRVVEDPSRSSIFISGVRHG